MLVIADSSALVALSTCDALDVLLQAYDDIRVPQAVYDEVIIKGKPPIRIFGNISRRTSNECGFIVVGVGSGWAWTR
jgi:predicted nucleic acid-binding protein